MQALGAIVTCSAVFAIAVAGCEAGPDGDVDYAPAGGSSRTNAVGIDSSARSGGTQGASGGTVVGAIGDDQDGNAQGGVDACGNPTNNAGTTDGIAGDSADVASGADLGNASANIPNATDGAGGFDGFVGTLGFGGIPRQGIGTGAAGSTGANAAGASENDGANRNNDRSENVSGGNATGGSNQGNAAGTTDRTVTTGGATMNGNHSPMAAFVLDPTCFSDATTTLTLRSASLDPDGDALTCSWSFPAAFDGIETGCILENVQVVNAGESILELLVTDGRGGASIVTRTVADCL